MAWISDKKNDCVRCITCRYYADGPDECRLMPPVYTGTSENSDGVVVPTWGQPLVDELTMWCGHWSPAEDCQTPEQRKAKISQREAEYAKIRNDAT